VDAGGAVKRFIYVVDR